MTEPLPLPALIWQSDIESLVSVIKIRHEKLSIDFNAYAYVVSESAMTLCARIQQHVNAGYERDGFGLLTERNHHPLQTLG